MPNIAQEGWACVYVNGVLRVLPVARFRARFLFDAPPRGVIYRHGHGRMGAIAHLYGSERWFAKQGHAIQYMHWRKRWMKQAGQWGKVLTP